MLAYGMVCALLEAGNSGQGQVVDAAMVDGASTLMASTFAANQVGFWSDERGTNVLDSGAHFYEVYETADGKYVTIASVEPQFYAALMEKLAEDAAGMENQWDMANWPALKEKMAVIFKGKTRDEWNAFFDGADICYAPVLSMAEVRHHPHHQARGTFIDDGEVWQPAPAPRFSRTPGEIVRPPAEIGAHSRDILSEFGFDQAQVDALLESGAVKQAATGD